MWASHVVDIPELIEIRKQFRYKWGKQFEADALQNVGGVINERVAAKLSVLPPSAYLVQTYLEKIADEHEVKWKPKKVLTAETMAEPMVPPVGYSVQVGGGSGLNAGEYEVSLPQNGGQNPSAPPLSPCVLSAAPSAMSKPQQPYVPNNNDEEEEIDIYVPGIAYATVKPEDNTINDDSGTRDRTQSDGEDSKPASAGEGSAVEESYEDLAARFAKLQR
jgi:hypothetical protein